MIRFWPIFSSQTNSNIFPIFLSHVNSNPFPNEICNFCILNLFPFQNTSVVLYPISQTRDKFEESKMVAGAKAAASAPKNHSFTSWRLLWIVCFHNRCESFSRELKSSLYFKFLVVEICINVLFVLLFTTVEHGYRSYYALYSMK